MVSRSAQIREWLATQDGPRSARAIANALGFEVRPVHVMVGEMKRSGMIVVHEGKPNTYSLGRGLVKWSHPTEEARQAAARESRRKYRERMAGRPARSREEYLAELKANKAERDALRRAKREQAAEARRLARALKPRKAPVRRVYRIAEGTLEPVAPKVRVQTVEEFLAQGGQVQRLGIGEVSKPLRFVGFRADHASVTRSRRAA